MRLLKNKGEWTDRNVWNYIAVFIYPADSKINIGLPSN